MGSLSCLGNSFCCPKGGGPAALPPVCRVPWCVVQQDVYLTLGAPFIEKQRLPPSGSSGIWTSLNGGDTVCSSCSSRTTLRGFRELDRVCPSRRALSFSCLHDPISCRFRKNLACTHRSRVEVAAIIFCMKTWRS